MEQGSGDALPMIFRRRGFISDGKIVPLHGRDIFNWHDDPGLRLRMGQDGRSRTNGAWVRSIIVHTTKGIPYSRDPRPQKIIQGKGMPSNRARGLINMWSTDGKYSGAHFLVDHDGTVYNFADCQTEMAYHATTMNQVSIGIEMYQGRDAELYSEQLASTADLIDTLTAHFRIQRQMPDRYRGEVSRLALGGKDCVGVFGHRDQTDNRGAGDPGRAIFDTLATRGYEAFDFTRKQDIDVWTKRQASLGIAPDDCDGIPGPATAALLRRKGYGHGLYTLGPPIGA